MDKSLIINIVIFLVLIYGGYRFVLYRKGKSRGTKKPTTGGGSPTPRPKKQ